MRVPTDNLAPARIAWCLPRSTARSPTGTTNCLPTVRRCRATATPTSASSAPATPGLWTAYYLKRADPSLRIAVLEARFAGFGASGRNGGWLSGLVPGDRNRMARAARPRRGGGLAAGAERVRRRGDRRRGARRHRRGHRQGRHPSDRPQRRAGVAAGRRGRGRAQLEGRRHRRPDESRSGRTDPARRRGRGLPQSALRPHSARTPGARAGRHRGAARRRHLRADAGHRDRPR